MNRAAFYAALRRRGSGVFGTSLSQKQVDGLEAMLDAIERHRISDRHHAANILAQVYHETGGRFSPVREAFADSDQQAVARLDAAWRSGKLSWVSKPYWRQGWFGRGFIQITHRNNYEKLGRAIGVDLVSSPSKALDPRISADIAVVGMRDGLFTGRSLSDYDFPGAIYATPDRNPRRIVNGKDGTDRKVAAYHVAFSEALKEAGWAPGRPAGAEPTATSAPPTTPGSGLAWLWKAIGRIWAALMRGRYGG